MLSVDADEPRVKQLIGKAVNLLFQIHKDKQRDVFRGLEWKVSSLEGGFTGVGGLDYIKGRCSFVVLTDEWWGSTMKVVCWDNTMDDDDGR